MLVIKIRSVDINVSSLVPVSILAVVDQNLVSWVLLFLSRSLDCATPGWLSEENTDKSVPNSSNREKESKLLSVSFTSSNINDCCRY